MCKHLIGDFLHHVPTSNNKELAETQLLFIDTLNLYEQTFAEKPPMQVWAQIGSAKCASPPSSCRASGCSKYCHPSK
jgi:hypothetical protein